MNKKTYFEKTLEEIKNKKQDKIQELIQHDLSKLMEMKKAAYDRYVTVLDLGFEEAAEIRYQLFLIIKEAVQVKMGNEETAWDAMT